MLKQKGGYVPIGAGEGAAAAAAGVAGVAGATTMVTVSVVVSVISVLVAAGAFFVFIPVFVQMNGHGSRLAQLEILVNETVLPGVDNATEARLTALEGAVSTLDFALQNLVTNEGMMMNATYEVLESGGICQTARGCGTIFEGPYTIYKATVGTVISLVVEIGPFSTQFMGSKRQSLLRDSKSPLRDRRSQHHARAPGDPQLILCQKIGGLSWGEFIPTPSTITINSGLYFEAIRFFTAGQRANMVILGDQGPVNPRFNSDYNADNYRIRIYRQSFMEFEWKWYPDWDACTMNSNFDFASPTKFAVAYITPPGVDAKRR